MMKSKRKSTVRTVQSRHENHCPVPRGVLVVIGGKENKGQDAPENKKKPGDFIKLEVLEKLKDLLHKKDPIIEVVTTSSSEGTESFNDYKKVFGEMGLHSVHHIHHETRKEV